MNLIALIESHASPNRVCEGLLRRFFGVAVDVVGNGDVWLKCFDGAGRCRLALRYWWSERLGWIYSILPQRRQPKRPYQPGGITYLSDGSYAVNP